MFNFKVPLSIVALSLGSFTVAPGGSSLNSQPNHNWILGNSIVFQGMILNEDGLPLPGAVISIQSESFSVAADESGKFSVEFTPSEEQLVLDLRGPEFPSGTAQALQYISRRMLVDLGGLGVLSKTWVNIHEGGPQQSWLLPFTATLQSRAEWMSPLIDASGGSFQDETGCFMIDVPAGAFSVPTRIGITRIKPAFSSNLDSPFDPASWCATELMQVDLIRVDADWNLISDPIASAIRVSVQSRGLQDIDRNGVLDGVWGLQFANIPHTNFRAGMIPSSGWEVVPSGSVSFNTSTGIFTFLLEEFSTHTASLPPNEGQMTANPIHHLQDNSFHETIEKCRSIYQCGNSPGACTWFGPKGETLSSYLEESVNLEMNLKRLALKAGVAIKLDGKEFKLVTTKPIALSTGVLSMNSPRSSGAQVGEIVVRHIVIDCTGDSTHVSHPIYKATVPLSGHHRWAYFLPEDSTCYE